MPVVTPPEEIGARNADRLRVILLEAAARGRARLVVDMTGTRFCASAGISELIRAHKRALAESGELRPVIPATGAVWRRGQSGIRVLVDLVLSHTSDHHPWIRPLS